MGWKLSVPIATTDRSRPPCCRGSSARPPRHLRDLRRRADAHSGGRGRGVSLGQPAFPATCPCDRHRRHNADLGNRMAGCGTPGAGRSRWGGAHARGSRRGLWSSRTRSFRLSPLPAERRASRCASPVGVRGPSATLCARVGAGNRRPYAARLVAEQHGLLANLSPALLVAHPVKAVAVVAGVVDDLADVEDRLRVAALGCVERDGGGVDHLL